MVVINIGKKKEVDLIPDVVVNIQIRKIKLTVGTMSEEGGQGNNPVWT